MKGSVRNLESEVCVRKARRLDYRLAGLITLIAYKAENNLALITPMIDRESYHFH